MSKSLPGFTFIQRLKSLQAKFLVIVLPPILICFLLFSGISTYLKHQVMQKEVREALESFMEIESNILAKPIWDVNYNLVETHAQTMLLHPHVSGIKIEEFDTKYTHKVGLLKKGKPNENDIILEKAITYPTPAQAHNIGTLTVISETENIHKALFEAFIRDFLLTLSLIGAIMLSGWIAYRYTISTPLNYFLQGIKGTKDNRKPQKVAWNSEDELGEVISAYNQLVHSLTASEQRFKSLAANLPGAVFQLQQAKDGSKKFTYVSEGVRDLLEISNKTMMKNQKAFDFLPEKLRKKITEKMDNSLNSNKSFDFEVHLNLHAGSQKWIRFLSRAHRDESNTILFDGIMLDVTEQKHAEQEKNELEQQLRQSQKMEAIGRLAGGIAHDFNNLLQVISGNIQIVLTKNQMQENKYLKAADQACTRASGLVTHLLTFSRKLDISFQEVKINKLVEETFQLLQRTLPKTINLQTRLTSEADILHADPNQLEHVLLNLANNAKDAMPDGGELILSTERINLEDNIKARSLDIKPGEYLLITVSDTGQGIDAEIQRYIFEPFFTTKEIGKGTGLGLASAYGIIKAHDGHMTCYSELGIGTSFKLYLPATFKKLEQGNIQQTQATQSALTGHEKLLIVDDEEDILEMTSEVLTDYGYKIFTAKSAEQGLEICQNQNPDLIVLDLGMPGMGGEGFLKKIKELDLDLKVIITSGYANHKLAKDPLKYGAIAFINKPYRFKEFLNQIRNILDKTYNKE